MANTIEKHFVHKRFGKIGKAKLVIDGDKWTLSVDGADATELGINARQHLMAYCLQSLQDAYAGAENADEAKGAFKTKATKITDDTIGTRAGGGVTDWTKSARVLVRNSAKGKELRAKPEWKNATSAERTAMIDEVIETNRDVLAPHVEKMLDAANAAPDIK